MSFILLMGACFSDGQDLLAHKRHKVANGKSRQWRCLGALYASRDGNIHMDAGSCSVQQLSV